MAILGGILESFDGTGDTIIVIPATSAAAYEPLYLLSQIKTVDGSGSDLDADLLDGYHASHFGTAAQVTNLQNTDISLQSQINGIFAIGSRLVFRENFTGNGSATSFVLSGALQNAAFSVGSWSAANILTALQVDITDADGKPIYDSVIPIYRDRIEVTSVDSLGNVTLNFAPLNGQSIAIWYWYQLQASNVLSYYYREDHVAAMEGDGVQMATQVDTDTTAWGNIVLRTTDNTVQKALNRLDSYVQALSGSMANIDGFTPYSGNGVSVAASGSDYVFSLDTVYTDGRYVNVTGDTMTGHLIVPSVSITGYAAFTPHDNTNPIPWDEGRVFYDADDKTLCYYNDNSQVKVNIGQEMLIRVVNKTGSSIPNGTVVYVNGSQGNRPTIGLASANFNTSHRVIGLTTCDINHNNNGYVTTEGLVRDVNTNGWVEGTELWLSETSGQYTDTKPVAPIHAVRIGFVLKQGNTDGIILVKVDTGHDIEALHDVLITSATSGDIISWDGEKWVNAYNIGNYSNNTTIASITGSLQSQINTKQNEITLVAGSNISILESPADTWTITSTATSSPSVSGGTFQGLVTCNTNDSLYSVSHPSIDVNFAFPTASLIVPSSGSNLFVQGITNRSSTSFNVVLSEVPNVTGYYISWHLPSSDISLNGVPVVNLAITNIPSYTTTISGSYNVSLSETVVYADNANTIILPSSPTTNESHWIVNTYTSDITIDGNGKNICVDGINNATLTLTPDSSLHIHFNTTKNKWYVI